MANQEDNLFKNVISHAKEYGFIFQNSEIYDGLSAVYDYGQNGAELKNNIKEYWWKFMTMLHKNIVGIDTAIFMHPTVWKASGHVDAFNDPMIDNKDSKKRYRADELVEDAVVKLEEKIEKEVEKAAKRFENPPTGRAGFNREMFVSTNPRVVEYQKKIDEANGRLKGAMNASDMAAMKQLIIDLDIADPVSGTKNWTDVRQFSLMFSTEMGSIAEDANKIYLRPETAQGIFVNFLNVQKTGRMKIPFGIAQIGKAFRNEIVARQFIFRMREFEQMEMQFFVKPGEEMKWYEYWKDKRMKWHWALGLGQENYRFHDHLNLAHYANAAADIQFNFPMGFKELEGIHSRTDFDLKSHEKFSGKKLQYFDPELAKEELAKLDPKADMENLSRELKATLATKKLSYIPYVVETSVGLDRMFLSILASSYKEEKLEDGSDRVVLQIPTPLAPIKVAILPLMKKDGLPEKAMEIMNELKFDLRCFYEEKDAIGKRYRRQDAIGTPYCITIDHQTLEDNTVTVRERDTMKQERVNVSALRSKLVDVCSINNLLRML